MDTKKSQSPPAAGDAAAGDAAAGDAGVGDSAAGAAATSPAAGDSGLGESAAGARATAPAAGRPPVVGMIGAGQLARMTAGPAAELGIHFRVLAAAAEESAAQVTADVALGDYRSPEDLMAFAAGCDVLTFDHEHVPRSLIEAMEAAGHAVRPGSRALHYTQDKQAMRERLVGLGYRCPRFLPVEGPEDVTAFARVTGWPVVLKAVSGGYDGRGVWVCEDSEEASAVLGHGLQLIAEEYVRFDRELAILVVRSPAGQGAAYPVVETVQQDGICREVLAPAPDLTPARAAEAQRLGLDIAAALGVTGLLAVELFETEDGLLVNELAMRPHNSGHWTMEGAVTSQFEQHLRAVLNLPLGSPSLVARCAVMVNVLGGEDPDLRSRLTHVMAADPGVKVHLYGKSVRPGRKVGHVTALGRDLEHVRGRARRAASYLAWGTEDTGEY
jgi:5-(carboxyamino)imidazole ribonucleotide synthase